MTLDGWGALMGRGAMLGLGRRIFGEDRARQIYRYRLEKRTGLPIRIPPADVMAKIYIYTDEMVTPLDFYEPYIRIITDRENRRLADQSRRTSVAGTSATRRSMGT